jgi:hypothetical protein
METETSVKRDIIILDCPEIRCPQVLLFVFEELCGAFSRRNYKVSIINNINLITNNSIVFMGNSHISSNAIDLLNNIAPLAIYIGWYWLNIDVTRLKYFIHTCENCITPVDDDHNLNKLSSNKPNICPLLLRANESIEKIGSYEKIIKHDYYYMGWGYCTHMIPTKYNGVYHGVYNHNLFLSYDTRKQNYLSSIFCLGFQAPENITNSHVSQRIYEGMAYGCIVLTNSLPAVEQTNGIAVLVNSKEEIENTMEYFLNNPDKLAEKQKLGYEFIKNFGTNNYSIDKFISTIHNNYGEEVV